MLRFGPFELDCATGELTREGTPVKLAPQPARVLAVLGSRPGRLVTREELRREVWGDDSATDVEQALNFAIKQARAALGDDAEKSRYIMTVPRRGYRLLAPPARRRRRWIAAAVSVLLVAAAAAWLAWRQPTPRTGRRPLLAVLPFENLSGDPAQEYLSDGITEETIAQLAALNPDRLGVIARTSVLRYKGAPRDAARIGRELGAQYLVEGSVRRARERVRISVQLIDTATQAHLWAATYDRGIEDLLALEAEVGRSVAREIAVPLLAPARAARPLNPAAYDAFLRGLAHLRRLTGEAGRAARDAFQAAIRLDPGYAPAYAGLADACYTLSNMQIEPAGAMEAARAAARQALELDPALAEAHLALARVQAFYDWDWTAADAAFRQALQLQPGSADASAWYGVYLALMGRLDDSIAHLERARRLDPLSPFVQNALGLPLYFAGRYDDAIVQTRRALELDPHFAMARIGLATALAEKGEFRAAIAEYERARQADDSPEIEAFLARTHAVAGDRAQALRMLRGLEARQKQRYVSPYDLALVYAGLGDRARAVAHLEKAYAARAEGMTSLVLDPRLSALRSEPGFRALVRRMNFPR